MPNWKKVIVSGSNASLNTLNVTAQFTASGLHYPTADGGEFSFVQSDGNGNLSLQLVNTINDTIYNGEATTILRGTPVYVSGSVGANPKVFRADAAIPAKMPVTYIVGDDIPTATTGRGIILGHIDAVNTTGYPEGTEIFVAPGGGWTSARPTGSAEVQVLGIVTKEGSGGKGLVLNPGPVLLPNLNSGSIWVGNSNSVPTAIATSSIQNVISASFAATASSVNTLTQNVLINGSLEITGSTVTSGSFTSYGSFIVIDPSGVPSADLGAARFLRDVTGVRSVDYQNRILIDQADVTTVDWKNAKLYANTTSQSVNWNTRVLTDATEATSLDWGSRLGYDNGIITLDWSGLALKDTGGTVAVDWRNRYLNDNSAVTRIEWDSVALQSQINHYAYSTNKIGLTTEAEPLANYPGYGNVFTPAGEIINGVTFDVGVSDYDMVSLTSTGTWVQTSMTTQDAFKMLGIAFNVGSANSVLLEGHMVVSSGSTGAPKISDLTIGKAVYMNTTSSGVFMSNTAPVVTGQTVRLLGHVYYNSTNDATWYTMKFRPSHDWVQL